MDLCIGQSIIVADVRSAIIIVTPFVVGKAFVPGVAFESGVAVEQGLAPMPLAIRSGLCSCPQYRIKAAH